MSENIKAGSDIHAGDGGYGIGTKEAYEAFVKKREESMVIKMKTKTVETFDWMEEVEPELLKNLNELLVAKGIEPLKQLNGGSFLDGKWVGVLESRDYRNYWHAYLELWGEKLHNDSYQSMWFNDPDDDEEWNWYKEQLREWAVKVYKPTDPNWTDDLVDSMRKVVKDHFPHDERITFWWSW